MADFNLEAMSLKELRQMQKDLAKAISTYEDRHKADARAKLEVIAKEMGYSLADLIGVRSENHPCASRGEIPTPGERRSHLVGPWPETAVVRGSAGRWQVRRRSGGLTDLGEPPGRSIVKLRKPVSADMTA